MREDGDQGSGVRDQGALAERCVGDRWSLFIALTALGLSLVVAAAYALEIGTYWIGYHDLIGPDGQIIGRDFANYWTAARLALSDRVQNLFDFAAYQRYQQEALGSVLEPMNWSYPPHLLLLTFWLGFFSYPAALALWVAVTFLGYAFAVAYKRPSFWVLVCVLFFAPASFQNIAGGQNGFLSAALLVGGLRLLDSRPAWAGALFGFLTFKPQLGLLVPVALVAGRRWRTLTVAALTAAALIAASLMVFGPSVWLDYYHVTVPYQQNVLQASTEDLSLFQGMMPTPFMALRLAGAPLDVAYAGAAVFAVFVLAAVVLAFRQKISADLRSSVVLTGALLASPYALTYDMTLLSVALVSMMASTGYRMPSNRAAALMTIAWLLPMGVLPMNTAGFPVAPFVLSALLAMQVKWMFDEPELRVSKSTM